MNKRLLSIILSEWLIALAGGQVEAQSLAAQTPVPGPQTMLVPVTTDSYPLGAADHLNVPEDLSKVGSMRHTPHECWSGVLCEENNSAAM